jgi:hypothetical protein
MRMFFLLLTVKGMSKLLYVCCLQKTDVCRHIKVIDEERLLQVWDDGSQKVGSQESAELSGDLNPCTLLLRVCVHTRSVNCLHPL